MGASPRAVVAGGPRGAYRPPAAGLQLRRRLRLLGFGRGNYSDQHEIIPLFPQDYGPRGHDAPRGPLLVHACVCVSSHSSTIAKGAVQLSPA